VEGDTNDAKEDWVLRAKDGRKMGAKPQLKKEMLTEAKVDFVLYSSDEFLDVTHKQLRLNVKSESVDEVKKYREREMERIHSMRKHRTLSKGYPYMINPKRWDELHHYVHRARILARDSMKHIDRTTFQPGIEKKCNALT
jgi:hypothetical protein